MHKRDQVSDALREIADAINAEPNLRARADMVGEFRRLTPELSRELLEACSYGLREQRFPLNTMSEVLHARRETINKAVLTYARRHRLPVPKGFQSWRIPPELIVGIPPRER
jgi:hypothetical protein